MGAPMMPRPMNPSFMAKSSMEWKWFKKGSSHRTTCAEAGSSKPGVHSGIYGAYHRVVRQPQPIAAMSDAPLRRDPLTIRMHANDNVAIVANDGGLPVGTVFASGLTLR